MRITKEQGIKIKKAILDRGYSITGFCRIHNISDRQFYAWLAGTNGYERNGIGRHFQDSTDALFSDKALDVATDATDATDYKRTDQWDSDWHDVMIGRAKCNACHAATGCVDCCYLCENRCDQYRTCQRIRLDILSPHLQQLSPPKAHP